MSSFKLFNYFDSISNVISISKEIDDIYKCNDINILFKEFKIENNMKI